MLESATPAALLLLRRLDVVRRLPATLPSTLWSSLEKASIGDAIEWHPPGMTDVVLGCTRYMVENIGFLLLMREVSDHRAAISEEVHRQRTESTGRLIASIAHDVRTSVASIIYSADFLDAPDTAVTRQILRDTAREICDATRRLQLTVDGLLDYAQLGPAIAVPVSLLEVLNRVQGLRSFYRPGVRRLRITLSREAEWVSGNPVVIEQIFVNLLFAMADRTAAPQNVAVRSFSASSAAAPSMVLILVADESVASLPPSGTEMETSSRPLIFAIEDARAAAESQGGRLSTQLTPTGLCFTVELPRSEGPR